MKIVIPMILLLTLSGCGGYERMSAAVTGWSHICVNGVSYLQFISGVTVEYTRDGKIKTCDK